MLSLLFAFLAGIVTIAAPCTLPVLPILLGASVGRASTVRPVLIAAGFVFSFTLTALSLGALTQAFDFDPNIIRNVASVMLVIFGVLMIWPTPFERLSIYLRGLSSSVPARPAKVDDSRLGGLLLGMTLGLVWTPCAGPVLGSILALIASSKDIGWAGLQLFLYATGTSIPMLAIAYGGQNITARVRKLARIAPRLQQGFGFVVIAYATAMYLQYDTTFVAWLTQHYPNTQIGL